MCVTAVVSDGLLLFTANVVHSTAHLAVPEIRCASIIIYSVHTNHNAAHINHNDVFTVSISKQLYIWFIRLFLYCLSLFYGV